MDQNITNYINAAPEFQREIMQKIRQIIHTTVPEVKESFKWSRPVFSKSGDFAYLKTAKAYVTLGFFNFKNLEDPDHLLEGTGKDMRHIKIKYSKNIDRELLTKWFQTAAED